jgi:V/A-type H+-transporting ATPase subunit F
MTYFVIGDEDTVLGFGMVGVRGKTVSDPAEAQSALEEAIEQKEVGIIIITERAAELIRPRVDQLIFTHAFPLIVEIPDRTGKIEGKPGLRQTVNQAIGIKI